MSAAIQEHQAFLQDERHSLLVKDANNATTIDRDFNKQKLNNEYSGDFKNYLISLKDRGINKVQITSRKKRGNTKIQVPNTLVKELTLAKQSQQEAAFNNASSKPADQSAGGSTQQNQSPMNTQYPQSNYNGMNGAEISKLMRDSELFKDYKRWYEDAAKKVENLKDKLENTKEHYKERYEDLKKEFDDYKFDKKMEDKPGTIDKIVDAIQNKPELLSGIMQALPQSTKQNQLQGDALGMAGANQLDATTQQIAQIIGNLNENDFENVANTVNHYALGTENFIPELEELLKKHEAELTQAMQQNQQNQS